MDRAAALQRIPGWEFDPRAAAWERQRQAVAAFAEQHNRLPQLAGSEEERQLALWCYTQRQRRRGHGTGAELTAEEAAKLEELPFWSWEPWGEAWERQWQAVAEFVQQHGRLPRCRGRTAQPLLEGERPLGKWCDNQRQRQRGTGRKAELTPEEADRLEALPGWRWSQPGTTRSTS